MATGVGPRVTNDDYDTVAVYLYRCGQKTLGLSLREIAGRLIPSRTERALEMRIENVAAADGKNVTYDHYAQRTKEVLQRYRDASCEEVLARVEGSSELADPMPFYRHRAKQQHMSF